MGQQEEGHAAESAAKRPRRSEEPEKAAEETKQTAPEKHDPAEGPKESSIVKNISRRGTQENRR